MMVMAMNEARDVVRTSDQDEVILAIDAARARRGLDLNDDFARVVRLLVLGVPVAGCELDQWGITAIGLLTASEAEQRRQQFDLFH